MANCQTILSKYRAANQTITNRYEQCRSSPTLGPPKMLTGAPLMVISQKRFLKRCCISIVNRRDTVVVVIYLSHGYSTGGGSHPAKQMKSLHNGTVAHMKILHNNNYENI